MATTGFAKSTDAIQLLKDYKFENLYSTLQTNNPPPPPQLSSHLTQMSLNAALNYMNHVFHLSPTHDKPARGAQTNERNPEISGKITKTYLTLEDYWGKKHGFRAFKFFLPSSNP